MYVKMYANMYMYTYIYVHINMYTNTYINMYMNMNTTAAILAQAQSSRQALANMEAVSTPGKRLRGKRKRLKIQRAEDKKFQRHMKAIMDGERPDVEQSPEALSFVERYNTTACNKIKAEMRDLWREAHEDFEFAGAILKARKNAFQETVTEGVWMSHEQLTDEMKNEEHARNFESFARKHRLEKFDPKKKCPVYYFTRQLQRCGSKTEASIEGNFKGKADDTEALCGLPMIEDCSYYSDSTDDEDSSKSDQKKGKKKKAHKGKKSSPSEKKDDKHKKGEKKGSDKKRDKKCQKKRKRHDSTSDSSSDKKKKGRKDKKEGKPHKTTTCKNAPKFKARAKRLAVLKNFKAPPTPQETSSSSSS